MIEILLFCGTILIEVRPSLVQVALGLLEDFATLYESYDSFVEV